MSTATPEQQAGALLNRACALIDLQRYSEALPLLADALRLNPESVPAYCNLAIALKHTGQLQRALEVLASAIRQAPDNEWPHRLRCIVLQNLKRIPEAIESAMQAHRLAPETWETAYTLGDVYLEAQLFKKAQAAADALLKLAPDNAYTFWLLGRIAAAQNRLLAAEAQLRRALNLNPTHTHLHNELGLVLQRQGRLKEALRHFHGALANDPTARHAQNNLYTSATNYLRQKIVFGSAKSLLEEISPAVYRYYSDRSRDAFERLLQKFLKGVLAPTILLMALWVALKLISGERDISWRPYAAVLLVFIGIFAIVTAFSWLGFVVSLARDRFPWLGPIIGLLLSPLMLVLLGLAGLSADSDRWPMYIVLIISGGLFALILWVRTWRGRYYTLLSRWYPSYERLCTKLRNRITPIIRGQRMRLFLLIFGNPLFYFIAGVVALYADPLSSLALLWIVLMCTSIVLAGIKLLRRISR